MKYVICPLYGPMQSWGWGKNMDLTDRDTRHAPTHSGFCGLLCAALGVDRHDIEGLLAVHEKIEFATLAAGPRRRMRDFTAVTNYARATGKPDGVDHGGNPVIFNKYYLADALFVVAAWSADGDLVERIARALLRPKYTLYLGRKSYTPSHAPLYVDPETRSAVFDGDPVQGLLDLCGENAAAALRGFAETDIRHPYRRLYRLPDLWLPTHILPLEVANGLTPDDGVKWHSIRDRYNGKTNAKHYRGSGWAEIPYRARPKIRWDLTENLGRPKFTNTFYEGAEELR